MLHICFLALSVNAFLIADQLWSCLRPDPQLTSYIQSGSIARQENPLDIQCELFCYLFAKCNNRLEYSMKRAPHLFGSDAPTLFFAPTGRR